MEAAFYFISILSALFIAALLLAIAYYPIYKLTGGGDTFLQYIDYFMEGPKV